MNTTATGLDNLGRGFSLANWLEPPYNRAAFQRVRQLAPTALIRNRSNIVRPLPWQLQPLDQVMVDRVDGRRTTFGEHLDESFCDAICVIHDGSVAFEHYANGMLPDTPHLMMSVSKSVCGALLGITIGRGLVSASDLVTDVAPEFAGTSLDGATVQQVIDMATGTDFEEDYSLYDDPTNDDLPLIAYERQAGYRPMGGDAPIGTLAHFRTYGTAFEHGSRFQYRSPLTNIAARILELAHGIAYPDLVSQELWAPLGQEHDADIMLDCMRNPVVEGGMSASVRDLARLGQAYLDNGVVSDRQLIPATWIDDTARGTDEGVANFAASDFEATGWSTYRNAFWIIERDQVFSGLGIFGQYCYIHRPSRTVIARFSTFPEAFPFELSMESTAAFATICESLG